MQAAFNGHVEIVRWLLTCPDINISLKDEVRTEWLGHTTKIILTHLNVFPHFQSGKTALELAKTDELKTMIGSFCK